ncbi:MULTISPECIES: DUF2790 domain-containing protein [Pseudomonas]|uniref:DUF2790 domain-containing protein n=1 Tax=Pseudomonas TaxID=286 RepID=UPI0008763197|nr:MULTISPECIES: DUF2790 domain-containing protein [Pseudomonas]MDB6443726.1 DUF2790 domain-containing protein [Pseudomonas sp. 21TX0197]MDT8904885.1 DUF2790 domain-containing protein [Pseudomonas prosekii]NHN68685.1 DUF2790 domain-containing protein [Pseudomonas fluorescens]ROO31496.1 hypothetical protein BIV09_02935 [Pseudomonas sp. 7SR1]ROO38020.1 hypothetical protein BIV08_02580 [Pseudomonas sp. AF76]
MNIRTVSIIGLLAVVPLGSPSLFAKEQTRAPAYEYGMPLDIAKVVRIEVPPSRTCEVVRAHMTYVNTQGSTEQVSFLQLTEACTLQ